MLADETISLVSRAYVAQCETWQEGEKVVRRVGGGMNNALYQVRLKGRWLACKLCVKDERQRARREAAALRLLKLARVDIAPELVGLDESEQHLPYPAVVYAWLEGKTLLDAWSSVQVDQLLESILRSHALRLSEAGLGDLPTAWMHWFDVMPYLQELQKFCEFYLPWMETMLFQGGELAERLRSLRALCQQRLNSSRVEISRQGIPLCLCHVDPSPGNAICGSDGRVRWVDWEYSGWGDPALDLAEFRWHIAYRSWSPAQHAWLREHYGQPVDDPGFEARLAFWDALLAVRWAFLLARRLWSEYNGQDRPRLTSIQSDRDGVQQSLVESIERAEAFYSA